MPSTADLATIRRWCGRNVGDVDDVFDGTDVDERIGRLGTAALAAVEILETIHAGMLLEDPAIMAISGDYSESKVENLQQLERKIAECRAAAGVGSVSVTYLTRTGRSR